MNIRPWDEGDRPQLLPMIQDSLAVGLERGGDILATPHNAEVMFQLGLAQASTGQPTLCATYGSLVMGYVMWGWVVLPMDVRYRTCLAGNSYVKAEWRHMGVAGALRQEAKRMCTVAGIERIMGPVHLVNEKGIKEFVSQGAWPTTVYMELVI